MKHWRKGLKRITAAALAAMMIGTIVDASALIVLAEEATEVTCNHVCDEACGGTEAASGSALAGCTHVHDETCGYNAGGYSYNAETNTYEVYTAGAMQAAIDAAEVSGKTQKPAIIKLMANLDLPGVADDPGNRYGVLVKKGVIIIDLNGYKLNGANGYSTLQIGAVWNQICDAEVTITDSSNAGTGVISNVNGDNSQTAEVITNFGGTLIVNKGTIIAEADVMALGIDNAGTLIINGGEISISKLSTATDVDFSYAIFSRNANASLIIKDGKISATGNLGIGVYALKGSCMITGGTITGDVYALELGTNVTEITITGGSFNGGRSDIEAASGVIQVLGVDKNGGKGATFPDGITVTSSTLKNILAEGAGFYDAGGNLLTVADDATSINETVTVGCAGHTGGTANCAKKAVCTTCGSEYGELDADNHGAMDPATGKCSNGCGNFLAAASVTTGAGTTYYAELQTAIDAAELSNGCTLKLENNITSENGFTIDAGRFTLELNSKKLYVTEDGLALTVNGSSLVIQDSTGEAQGSILNNGFSGHALSISNNGIVELKSGELNDNGAGASGVEVYNGTFSQSGGTVTGDIFVIGTCIISGGTVTGSVYWYAGTIDVSRLATTIIDDIEIVYDMPGETMSELYAAILLPEGYALYRGDNLVGKDDAVNAISQMQIRLCDHSGVKVYSASENVIKETCEICKTTFGTVTVTAENPTFDGTAKEVTVTKTGTLANAELVIAYYEDGILLSAAPVDAGTYTAKITYNEKTASIDYTIAKANATVATTPTAKKLTYTGSAQELVTAGTASGGTMQYSLAENGTYSETIPTGTDAGEYTVWYKVAGDANHNDTAPASVVATIAPKAINVTARNTSKTYGGTDPAIDYVVTGLEGNDDLVGMLTREAGETVGTYAITQGTLTNENNPNYNISFVEGTFTINKAANAPNMPSGTMNVAYSVETVGAITLPEGWAWKAEDASKALTAGTAVTATAVYNGADKGNYETETVEVAITRSSGGSSGGGGYYPPYYPSYPVVTQTPVPTVAPTTTVAPTATPTVAPTVAPTAAPSATPVPGTTTVPSSGETVVDENGEAVTSVVQEPGTKTKLSIPGLTDAEPEAGEEAAPVIWESSNPDVAEVDEDGNVTMKKPGLAEIVVTVGEGEDARRETIVVLVEEPRTYVNPLEEAFQDVRLGTSWADIPLIRYQKVGETVDINFWGVKNWKKGNYEYVWKTSDESVATVDKKGCVTALKPGVFELTLGLKNKADGHFLNVQSVEIVIPGEYENKILLGTSKNNTFESIVLNFDERIDINFYGVENWKKEEYEYYWSSSEPSVVWVDNLGRLVPVKPGKAEIFLVLIEKKNGAPRYVVPMEVTVPEK